MRTVWGVMALSAAALLPIHPAPSVADAGDEPLAGSIDRAKHATVGILRHSEDEASQATKAHFSVRGSGVHIRDGYILTARHAVKREEGGKTVIPKEITVLTGELDELPAVLKGVNTFLDVALYRLSVNEGAARLGKMPFAGEEINPGDEVFTVGYPLGWGPTIGFGRIGNPNTFLPTVHSRLLQVDLAACSGNSGGGLFNAKGEIVGLVHAIIQTETIQEERRCSRFAFAVPGPLVERIAIALIEGKRPGFSRLGVQLTAIKRGTRWRVAVSGVTGPAQDAGIRKGDILLSIDGTNIRNAAQLKTYLIERTMPGQRITIKVLRDQAEQHLSVTLGKS